MSQDNTNPNHYKNFDVEPIDLIDSYGLTDGMCRGNIIKYTARAPHKNGKKDDLKALWYNLYLLGFTKEYITDMLKSIEVDIANPGFTRSRSLPT